MYSIIKRLFALMLLLVIGVSMVACDLPEGTEVDKETKQDNETTVESETKDKSEPDTDNEAQPSAPAQKPEEGSRNCVAVIGEHKLSAAELNYFYFDAINEFCNTYGNYLVYILDTNKPLNQQIYDKNTGETWADYFLNAAIEKVKSTYKLYDLAMANGFTLSEEQQNAIEETMSNLDIYAKFYGFKSVNAYLKDFYGKDAKLSSFRAYYEMCYIASAYYQHYADSLAYDYDALRAYEADKAEQYNAYTFSYYYLNSQNFLEGGVTNNDGEKVYSDEEKAAAANTAKALAEQLAAGSYADVDVFDSAVKALLSIPGGEDAKYAVTLRDSVLYNRVNSLFVDWISDPERSEGDLTIIANKDGDGTIQGYYVVRFGSVNDNSFYMKNVRHILLTCSAAEMQATKVEAEKLLSTFCATDMSEESFAKMATEYTDDPGSKENGGLYEDIYPGQMVAPFEDWCYDEYRQPGDFGLVQTDYGWHLMYFVGNSETTYRDYMLVNDLRNEDLAAWLEDLVTSAELTLHTTEYVNMEYTIN